LAAMRVQRGDRFFRFKTVAGFLGPGAAMHRAVPRRRDVLVGARLPLADEAKVDDGRFFLPGHDLLRKPATTPDQVRGRLFENMSYFLRNASSETTSALLPAESASAAVSFFAGSAGFFAAG